MITTNKRLVLSLFLAAAVVVSAPLAAASVFAGPVLATNIGVTTTEDEDNSDGDCSLREAIIAANTDAARDACAAGGGGDTVTVPAGYYYLSIAGENEDAAATGDLDVSDPDGLTISGAGARAAYVYAGSPDRVLDIRGGASAEISGVTISRGHEDQGAGVRNSGTLTLRQVILAGNEAEGPLTGIIFAGGVFGNGGTLNVVDSTVSGNSSSFGSFGGIYQQGGTANITNTTISGNSTVGINGGVQAFSGATVNIESSTIASNTSTQPGGGIHANGNTTTVNVKNSIVSGNTLDNCDTLNGGTITSLGNNISSDGSCGFTLSSDRQNTNALIGQLSDNGGPTDTHALLDGSPAIDEGVSNQALDQRGEARPQDGDGEGTATDDVGAFETEPPPPPPPFVVNETGDAADADITDDRCDADSATAGRQCTLRAAIEESNDTFEADTIEFDIGGTGSAKTISPTAELPAITGTVAIDGYTQTGASQNTLTEGNDAILNVMLGGLGAGTGADGLEIRANNCTIKGLVIKNFDDRGIEIIGATGTHLGGTFVGVNRDGITDRGNGFGVYITGDSNTVGGMAADARNVISGNDVRGVDVSGAQNTVAGNYVGTTADGTEDLGNLDDGVLVSDADNTIGGTVADARNVISGNDGTGVRISGPFATGNRIEGNFIGTTADGTAGLGNAAAGTDIGGSAYENTIGGRTVAAGNRIAHNGRDGAEIFGTATNNTILSNRIYSNGGLGIDLRGGTEDAQGVTTNDTGDPDTGANNLQNFPVIRSATRSNSTGVTTVSGSLQSVPGEDFNIQCFLTPNGTPASANGEGFRRLGTTSVSTGASGNARFSCTSSFPLLGQISGRTVSATATNQESDDTSEFSKNKAITISP